MNLVFSFLLSFSSGVDLSVGATRFRVSRSRKIAVAASAPLGARPSATNAPICNVSLQPGPCTTQRSRAERLAPNLCTACPGSPTDLPPPPPHPTLLSLPLCFSALLEFWQDFQLQSGETRSQHPQTHMGPAPGLSEPPTPL